MSQRLGSDFEKIIEESFDAYKRAGFASLDFMPVPMYPTGMSNPKSGAPLYSPKGKPPFDIYGFWHRDATMIGAEAKCNGNPQPSMHIVGEGKDGTGLEFHQIDALATLASHGGLARLIWNNGGEVGVLWGAKINDIYNRYLDAIKTEKLPGGVAPRGSKSIKWEEFKKIERTTIGGVICYDWLISEAITA